MVRQGGDLELAAGEHDDVGGNQPYSSNGGPGRPVGWRIAASQSARDRERTIRRALARYAIAGPAREVSERARQVTHPRT